MGSIWMVRRSTTDRKLSGLCGGIAAQWGIDPLLVRIGGVVLAVSGGIGLVLYAAGWLLIPEQGAERSKLEEMFGPKVTQVPRAAWIAIVAVACVISTSVFGSLLPFGLGPALILAGIWYFGYYRGRRTDAPPPTGADTPPVQPWQPPARPDAGSATSSTGVPGPSAQTPPQQSSAFAQAAEAWQRRVAEAAAREARQQEGPEPAAPPTSAEQPQRPYRWTAAAPGSTAPSPSTADPTIPGPAARQPAAPEPTEPAGPAAPPPADTEYQQPPWAAAASDEQERARAQYFMNPDPVGLYQPEPPVPVPTVTAPARPGDRPSARRLRLVGLVVLGLVLAGLGVADALGAPITATVYVAAALLVVGLTLVAATWLGRARGILPVGILLAVALAGVAVADSAAQVEEWARDSRVYTTESSLPTTPIAKEVGLLDLDLSRLELTRDARLEANVDFGSLRVRVPDSVDLDVRYQIDHGTARLLDQREQAGSDLADTLRVDAGSDAPTLTLVL
ncbi:MAG TPA: PspC domain-containing protein, partial [Microlunatus sp.]|nr:PspC domain-containing protein [Microlunatus sp.]